MEYFPVINAARLGAQTTAAVSLNGATAILDLTGKNLGSSTLIQTLTFAAGTLQNVGEINNGANLSKTTSGTLTLTGTSTFTGGVTLNAGNLNINQ